MLTLRRPVRSADFDTRSAGRRTLVAVALSAAALAGVVALPGSAQADTVRKINATTTWYETIVNDACQATLAFQRDSNGANRAQGIISINLSMPWYNTCVGALYESSNGGRSWYQVSGTHTASTWSWSASSLWPTTYWYADGAKLLAKTCVREHFGHTDTWTHQVCTTAH
jgi:hypothetical protein